jgi:hypothetical protein
MLICSTIFYKSYLQKISCCGSTSFWNTSRVMWISFWIHKENATPIMIQWSNIRCDYITWWSIEWSNFQSTCQWRICDIGFRSIIISCWIQSISIKFPNSKRCWCDLSWIKFRFNWISLHINHCANHTLQQSILCKVKI